jgi:hypothetical protein
MAPEEAQQPPGKDPDNVPETLCIGKFNLTMQGAIGTSTFTHIRPRPGPLLDEGQLQFESVVRARIVTTIENLAALRDLLDRVTKDSERETSLPATSGGGGRLN